MNNRQGTHPASLMQITKAIERRSSDPSKNTPTSDPDGGNTVGPVGLEPTTYGLKVRSSTN